jgi:hypothetical protein
MGYGKWDVWVLTIRIIEKYENSTITDGKYASQIKVLTEMPTKTNFKIRKYFMSQCDLS